MITAKNLFVTALAAVVISTFLPATAQADAHVEPGEVLADTCLGCHGIAGYRNAYPSFRVPKIGGQKAGYIELALKAYRAGTREHPTMNAQAEPMTDQEIADLAAYFEGETMATDNVTRDMIAGVDAAQTCLACHGAGVEGVVPTPPTLSGQEKSYLVYALNQYKSGARTNNIMTAFAAALSDADIEAIAEIWSREEGLYTPQRKD